jgi:hypothetical protein
MVLRWFPVHSENGVHPGLSFVFIRWNDTEIDAQTLLETISGVNGTTADRHCFSSMITVQ